MNAVTPNRNDKAKAKDGNDLGINKTLYATGYSVKDGLFWGAGIFVVLLSVLTFGKNLAPVKWSAKQLDTFNKWTKNTFGPGFVKNVENVIGPKPAQWFRTIGKSLKGPVIVLSGGVAYFASHVFMAPGFAHGWKKASDAIDKYNTLSEERDQLVTTNNVLKEDNDRLNAALAEMKNNRPSLAERTAQSAQAGISTSL